MRGGWGEGKGGGPQWLFSGYIWPPGNDYYQDIPPFQELK
jgi:hypothetical protein